jgi:oligosaccharide repeat unit polymerase
MQYILLVIAAVFLILNWLVSRDSLYPPLVLSVVWLVVAIAAVIQGDRFFPMSNLGFFSILLDLATFTFVGQTFLRKNRDTADPSRRLRWLGSAVWGGIAMSGLVLPVFLLRLRLLAEGTLGLSTYPAIRWTVNYGPSMGWPSRAEPLAEVTVALASFALARSPDKIHTRIAFAAAIAVAAGYVIPTGARSALFRVIVLAVVPMLLGRSGRWRKLSGALVLSVIMFALVGSALGKTGESFYDEVVYYAYAPVVAYGANPDLASVDSSTAISLRFFAESASRLGFNVPTTDTVLPYTNVPTPINIYTVFFPYFHDGGALGLVAALMLFALVTTKVYLAARRNTSGPGKVLAFSVLTYAMLMHFAVDQYFFLASLWVQYAVYYVALKEIGRLVTVHRQPKGIPSGIQRT